MKKQWYKSKTVWAVLVGAALSVLTAVEVPIPTWVFGVLASFGLYGVRDALK